MTVWLLVSLVLSGCDKPKPVDVFFISVDTLWVDHVGAYNPLSPAKTPHIDALAADAVRFDDAFSPISVTGPAFASVMTAKRPGGHGMMVNLFRNGTPLAPSHRTVAESFLEAGYRTAAIVSAFTLRPALGLDRGFSVYNSAGNRNREGRLTAEIFGSWLSVTEGPVFVWTHSFDPHGPFKRHLEPGDVHGGLEREAAFLAHIPDYQQIEDITDPSLYEALYARGVEVADQSVGQVVAAIKATGRYDDALIVFFADHGEGFRERDLWYDHGAYPHVEQTGVPLLVKYPRGRGAGETDSRLVSLMDIAPTALATASLPGLVGVGGVSLKGEDALHSSLGAESSHCKRISVLKCAPHGGGGKLVAVRTSTVSLVSEPQGQGLVKNQYDRRADPKEWMAVPVTYVGVALDELNAMVAQRRDRVYPPLPGLAEKGPDVENLRDLGYLE